MDLISGNFSKSLIFCMNKLITRSMNSYSAVRYILLMHRYTFAYIATTAVTNRGKRTSLYFISEQHACFDRPARSRAKYYLLPGRSLLPSPIASSCREFGLRRIRGIGDQERADLVSARGPCETKKKGERTERRGSEPRPSLPSSVTGSPRRC